MRVRLLLGFYVKSVMNMLSVTQKMVIVGIVAFLVGFGASYVWFKGVRPSTMVETGTQGDMLNENGDSGQNQDVTQNQLPQNTAGLLVKEQKPGSEVVVAMAHFDEPGWVVIYEYADEKLGRILGAQLFDKGEHPGVVSLLRPTTAGATYVAMAQNDDGDHRFDLAKDTPIMNADGEVISVKFLTTDNPRN